MKKYEILVERINPCGGDAHEQKEIIEAACETPESYIKENALYPVIDRAQTTTGDMLIVTGDGKGSMIRYTFTEL